jgi:hypothetical protein
MQGKLVGHPRGTTSGDTDSCGTEGRQPEAGEDSTFVTQRDEADERKRQAVATVTVFVFMRFCCSCADQHRAAHLHL